MFLQSIVFHFLVYEFSFCSGEISNKEYDRMPDIFLYDDYDKCLFHSLEDDPLYCVVTVQLFPDESGNSSAVWDTIQEVNGGLGYRHDLLRHGICTTKICENNQDASACLDRIYKSKYKNLNLSTKILEIHCEKKNLDYPLTTEDILFIAVVGLYVFFVLTVSFWSEIVQYNFKRNNTEAKKSPVGSLISAFSIFHHVHYILNKDAKSPGQNYFMFIQTMRFFISSLIITIHSAGAGVVIPVLNVKEIEQLTDTYFGRFFSLGSFIVAVFFVISSWLLTVNFFSRLKKTGEVSLGYVAKNTIRRYIRLTSGQIFFLVLNRTWVIRFGRGFFYNTIMGEEYRKCREKWWANLLCINNFMTSDGMCLAHTWSLSVEFQLSTLGLIILWFSQNNPKKLFLAVGGLIGFQAIFLFFHLTQNNYNFLIPITPATSYAIKFMNLEEWNVNWTTTYSNLAGLASGLCFGYLSFRYQSTQIFTKNTHRILWWLTTLTSTFGIFCFLMVYYLDSELFINHPWLSATLGSVCKPIFLLGVGLFIFGMSQGLGGITRNLFNWNVMHTLGQLSFGAYVLHPTFVLFECAMTRSPQYLSYYWSFTQSIRNICLAYLYSMVLTSFFLMPADILSRKLI